MEAPTVTVITVTRGRPTLLRRAIESVAAQDLTSLAHFVIVDDCGLTRAFLQECSPEFPRLSWACLPRPGSSPNASGPPVNDSWPAARCAFLRNYGIHHSPSPWISFLDDDNEFEPNHLSSLLECARLTGARAVHAWLQLFHQNGQPYLDSRHPWTPGADEARRRFHVMVGQGILEPGSNVVRHRAYSEGSSEFIPAVDTSEWLLERSLLLEVPVPEEYSEDDCIRLRGEDDKLLDALLVRKEPIGCSRTATLRYYLGGYSNGCLRE